MRRRTERRPLNPQGEVEKGTWDRAGEQHRWDRNRWDPVWVEKEVGSCPRGWKGRGQRGQGRTGASPRAPRAMLKARCSISDGSRCLGWPLLAPGRGSGRTLLLFK